MKKKNKKRDELVTARENFDQIDTRKTCRVSQSSYFSSEIDDVYSGDRFKIHFDHHLSEEMFC